MGKTAAPALLALLVAAPALAGDLQPVLGTNEQAHLSSALRCLNMTEADPGFDKDLGKPRLALQRTRELLADPLGLPALADRVLASAAANPQATWTLTADLLEVSQEPDLEVTVVRNEPRPWDALPADLARGVTRFFTEAEKADALVQRAFAELSGEERQYLAASYLAGLFNAEDRPPVRAALMAAGVESQVVARVIREGLEVDPEPGATNFLAVLQKVKFADLLAAGSILQRAAGRLADSASGVREWPAQASRFETALGAVEIGSRESDVFTNRALLILDPGGADCYEGAAAVANGLTGGRLAAVVDLAGNDGYEAVGLLGAGAGLFGAAVIVDCAGDDAYRAAYAGQGAGVFGMGWLEDRAGDDFYRAQAHAQAAGYAGLGHLRDEEGADLYDVGFAGQGYAGVMGVGLLVDARGNDRYLAGGIEPDYERHEDRFVSLAQGFAIGMRPFAGGGVAALVDLGGNDSYGADIYGQGVSYWYSVGMLLDVSGNDTYAMYQYGQGAGIHLSSGLLADGGGNDSYTGHTLMQGCAHDYAVGMLFDQGGDDTYTAVNESQGRAMNTALAILADSSGDDSYFAGRTDACQGIGNAGDKREYGSLALMLDLGGRDRYSCGAADGARLPRPDFGIVYDLAVGAASGRDDPASREDRGVKPLHQESSGASEQTTTSAAPCFDPKTVSFDELIFHAQRYANTPEKRSCKDQALGLVRSGGTESLRNLMGKAHLENIGIGELIRDMVEKLPASESAPVLAACLDAERPRTRRVAAFFLGYHPTPEHADRILPLLKDDEACGSAIRTLGKWRVRTAVTNIVPFLSHEKEVRRIVAANALRDIGDPKAVPHLVPLLGDRVFTVRSTAARALSTLGAPAEKALLAALPSAQEPARRHIIRTLGVMKSRRAVGVLRKLELDPDPFVRDDAARAAELIRSR
ncbi:MAG: HEAT repeat domain-containing protein [Verrucomicrobiota bacterium]